MVSRDNETRSVKTNKPNISKVVTFHSFFNKLSNLVPLKNIYNKQQNRIE